MKNKLHGKTFLLILFLGTLMYNPGIAQATQQNLSKTILFYDSAFWQTFNSCDIKNMEKYFTEDLEFYHDKGGLSKGIQQFLETTKKNLCSNTNYRIKREVVPGSTQVFPLTRNDSIYGAILSGEHVFYVIENNNPPRLDGRAKFTHVWLLQNNTWKMARILSYDHGPAVKPGEKATVQVPAATLDLYVGKYNAPQTGKITVERNADHLVLLVQEKRHEIYPESENKFFLKERNVLFEFSKGSDGTINKMIVWENGKIAEEAIREK